MVKFWNIVEPDLAGVINMIVQKFGSIDTDTPIAKYLEQLIADGVLDSHIVAQLAGKVKLVVPTGNKVGTVQYYMDFVGNACVVDLGADEGTSVISSMIAHGVQKVTALCITHMHNDHCTKTAVQRLLDSTINTDEMVLYWSVPDWSKFHGLDYASVYTAIRQLCADRHIAVIDINTEGYAIETGINGLSCNAYNCSDASYSKVYGNKLDEDHNTQENDNLNYFSVCYKFAYGHSKIICCGDIMPANEAYLKDLFTDCQLYSVPHHALTVWSDRSFNVCTPATAYVGAYGNAYDNKVIKGYPDTAHKKLYTNRNREIVFDVSMFDITGIGELVNTNCECGHYLEPGENLLELPYGKYYSANNTITQQLINIPEHIGSGFQLDVMPYGRNFDKHLFIQTTNNTHSNMMHLNTPDNHWRYFRGEDE